MNKNFPDNKEKSTDINGKLRRLIRDCSNRKAKSTDVSYKIRKLIRDYGKISTEDIINKLKPTSKSAIYSNLKRMKKYGEIKKIEGEWIDSAFLKLLSSSKSKKEELLTVQNKKSNENLQKSEDIKFPKNEVIEHFISNEKQKYTFITKQITDEDCISIEPAEDVDIIAETKNHKTAYFVYNPNSLKLLDATVAITDIVNEARGRRDDINNWVVILPYRKALEYADTLVQKNIFIISYNSNKNGEIEFDYLGAWNNPLKMALHTEL